MLVNKNNQNNVQKSVFSFITLYMSLFVAISLLFYPIKIKAEEIIVDSTVIAPRIAPGESIPLRVKIANFGNNNLTDVTITYQIKDPENKIILTEKETVAVETTASYIRSIALPKNIQTGLYTAETHLEYSGQISKAVGTYQFNVEKKIAGIFVNDIIQYGVFFLIVIGILFVLFSNKISKHQHQSNDYGNLPNKIRVYYEIIDEIIKEMRLHQGDKILETVGENILELKIDENTGKVLEINDNPANVVAKLVSTYQAKFGKNINLMFSKNGEKMVIVK